MLINENKKCTIFLLLFAIALILLNLIIPKILFGDVEQYVGVAKEFAGIGNTRIHNPHSFVYSILISPFLKLFPYLITIKIINLIWLILIGLLLYISTKKIKTLLIWIFSPIVWYMAGWISPILPVAFLITWSYLLFKKWERTNRIFPFILSAIFLGVSSMLWDGIIFINLLFILIFFFNKELKKTFFYLLIYSIIFSLRFIIDYIIFKFPFYSIVRFFGAWVVILLGLNKIIKAGICLEWIWLPIIISPLLFMVYKVDYKKYLKEILFLIISLFIFSPMAETRYLLVLAPISILLLNTVLKNKDLILIHVLVSIFIVILIFFMGLPFDYETPFFFSETSENQRFIKNDLKKIDKDFAGEGIIAGGEKDSGLAAIFSVFYWGKNIPEFIWADEYYLSTRNQTVFTDYIFESKTKIKESRKLKIHASLERPDQRDLSYVRYMITKKNERTPESFKLIKCYTLLCVYKK